MSEEIRSLLHNFFSNIFSEALAPSLFIVIDFHCSQRTDRNLVDMMIQSPDEAYKLMVIALGSEDIVVELDNVLVKYLNREYNIRVTGVIRLLRHREIDKLIRIAKKYDELRRRDDVWGTSLATV